MERELGTCPAAQADKLDGINDGSAGGRSCWAIAGTFCGGEVQGSYAQKLGSCLKCDFHTFVRHQQREKYVKTRKILDIMANKITVSCVMEELEQDMRSAI